MARVCPMARPSQRMGVAKAAEHPGAFRHQPQASLQGSQGASMTSSRDWQLLACRSLRLDTVPSVGGDSGTVVHPRSFLHHTRIVRGQGNEDHQELGENIPIAMMPRDHISTFGPYSLRVTTSGAIQYGVPTIVFRFACAGSEICAQKPKSADIGNAASVRGHVIRENRNGRTEFNIT